MPEYRWANPEKIGVLYSVDDRDVYVDVGDELARAIQQGPLDYVDPTSAIGPTPQEISDVGARLLTAKRARMVCSRLQGRLVLGPDTCAALDAMAEDPDTLWAMRETIKNAGDWRRLSPSMDELGYLLGYSHEAMDALFEQAMAMQV